jgi:hypothetical protein
MSVFLGFAKKDYMADTKAKVASVPKHHAIKACGGMKLKELWTSTHCNGSTTVVLPW